MTNERILQISKILLRIAIGTAFLSAQADRFGLYGHYGTQWVSWGDWQHFLQSVAYLNWYMPKALIPTLAVLETIIESSLGVALLMGIYQRIVAWASAALLLSFGVTMTIRLGIKAPMSFGVPTYFAAALLLGAVANLRPACKQQNASEPQRVESYSKHLRTA